MVVAPGLGHGLGCACVPLLTTGLHTFRTMMPSSNVTELWVNELGESGGGSCTSPRGAVPLSGHTCMCPPLGPLAAGIWGLHSASTSVLCCNALSFAVMAPSAMSASLRLGQWLPQWGKAWCLQLAVLSWLVLQLWQWQWWDNQDGCNNANSGHDNNCDNDNVTTITTATRITWQQWPWQHSTTTIASTQSQHLGHNDNVIATTIWPQL